MARAVPAGEYSGFGAYWSMSLIVGFGAFLPVELELARSLSARRSSHLPARTGRTTAFLVAGCLATIAAAVPLLVPAFAGDAGPLAPLGVLVVVSAGQFLLRGLLLGQGRLQAHGSLLLVDSLLRVVFAISVAQLSPGAGQTAYAWTLVAAAAVTHLPVLWWMRFRPGRHTPEGGNTGRLHPLPAEQARWAEDSGAEPPRAFPSAVAHLLLGSLSAQVLLNSSPVLIAAVATPTQATAAAAYVATFTLVRLPLFVAVPLQSALVPLFVGARRRGGASAVRRLVLGTLASTLVAAAAALALGLTLGPWVVGLLFGEQYALTGQETGLLAAGAGLHLGLLVLSQVLVAAQRHRRVAVVWSAGLVAGVVVFLTVPDLVLRASLAFTAGSAVALVISGVFLVAKRTTDALPHPDDAVTQDPVTGGARPVL